MFLGGWQAAEGAMAWYVFLVIRQYHKYDGNCACLHGMVGKLGKESKNRTKCQGVVVRYIKGEEVEKDAFGFQSQ